MLSRYNETESRRGPCSGDATGPIPPPIRVAAVQPQIGDYVVEMFPHGLSDGTSGFVVEIVGEIAHLSQKKDGVAIHSIALSKLRVGSVKAAS